MLDTYKDSKWVIGVSGGIDSMSLLDMAFQEGLEIVICHVNYHVRSSSNRDQRIVEEYAQSHGIPCYVREVTEEHTNNFEAWARDYRYSFYKEICQREGCKGVMLAHHADDFLETAFLRKQQGRNVSFYGIRESGYVNGLYVVRPLLHLFKDDLEKYIEDHHIIFGQDETNFDSTYERNKIRNLQLKHLTKAEKNAMLEEFQLMNQKIYDKELNYRNKLTEISENKDIKINKLLKLSREEGMSILRIWLHSMDDVLCNVSDKFLNDLYMFICSSKSHTKEIRNYLILKEYGLLRCIVKENYSYSYVIEELGELTTPYFQVRLNGTLKEGITVSETDLPLTIRSVQDGDKIHFSFGHRNLKHYFIDQKIAYEERQKWPVVVNSRGEIIFVCNLGSNIEHFTNKPNLFVVK